MVDTFDEIVDEGKEEGLSDDQAKLQAFNELARTPEGEAAISEAAGKVERGEPVEPEVLPEVTEAKLPEGVRGLSPRELVETREEMGTLADYTDDVSFRAFLGEHTKYWSEATYNKAKAGEPFAVYRAVPTNIKEIHSGAWVTQSKEYAESHLESVLRGKGHIIEGTARAVDLIAMSENEFFYAPGVTPPAIPRAEPGMPEAGIQPPMIPEVPARVVRPRGKGRVVQISMEDQLKLEQARQAAEEADAEVKGAYEAQAEIEGLRATHKSDPLAQKRILIGKKKVGKGEKARMVDDYRGLDFFISLREQTFPEFFTVKQAQALMPLHEFPEYTQPGTPKYNKVPRDVALDDLSKEFNMTPDEIADRVTAIRKEKRKIKDFEREIQVQLTEKPLAALPEPKPAEVALSPTGGQMLTPAQRVKTLDLFGKYVESGKAIDAWALTRELRRETLAGRAGHLKARAQELIVSKGIAAEEAMNQAIRETMAGELPTATTDYLSDLTNRMRETLFDKVYQVLKDEPFEMMSTAEALTNALIGRAIPRELGVKGGSAFTRLQRVFGDQPKVLKALDTSAKKGEKLEDVVEGMFHEIGREPVPLDQETADYLRGLSSDVIYTPTPHRKP
ncbi:hypothetical protein ES705_39378 [subsurface metagenome]